LTLNETKTVLATKKYKRMVTGLILTNDGKVSLGHERKRRLRAAIHNALQNKLSAAELASLGGLLGFAEDVEPDFVAKLEAKYGAEFMQAIRRVAGTTLPR